MFCDFGSPGRRFLAIFGPNQNGSPQATFSVFFLKTVILSKSCSHCRNNRIFKGRTLQKSVRRATPNGNRKKKR